MPFLDILPGMVNDMAWATLSAKDPTKKDFFSSSLPRLLSGAGGGFGFGDASNTGFGFDSGGGAPTFAGLGASDVQALMNQFNPQSDTVSPFGSQAFTSGGGSGMGANSVTGGPGPVTAQDSLNAAIAAALQGQDVNPALEGAVQSNQADARFSSMANSMIGGARNINSLTSFMGNLLGTQMGVTLGPAGFPILATQLALKALQNNANKQNALQASQSKQAVQMAEQNAPVGMTGPRVSGSEADPSGTGGTAPTGLAGAVSGQPTGSLGLGLGDVTSSTPVAFGDVPADTSGLATGPLGTTPSFGMPSSSNDPGAAAGGIGSPGAPAGGEGGIGPGGTGAGPAAGGGVGVGGGVSGAGIGEGEGGPGDGGAGGGGGGGGGGTVICTAYMRLGYLDRHTWYTCSSVGLHQSYETMRGYRRWAQPFSEWLQSHPRFARAFWPVVKWWVGELTGKHPHVIMRVAVPICKWLGR